jgi:DNA-binding transcriptional regulator of glucitol operon
MEKIKKEEFIGLISAAFVAGEMAGKAKEKKDFLMSEVGKGIAAMQNGKDSNSVLGEESSSFNPNLINDLSAKSQEALDSINKIIEESWKK